MDTTRRTYSVQEAGRLLGISRTSAYEAAAKGQLPTLRIGKRLLVPRAALDRLLEGGAPAPESVPAGRQINRARAPAAAGDADGGEARS